MNFNQLLTIINEAISIKDVSKFQLKRRISGAYNEKLNKVFKSKDRLVLGININPLLLAEKSTLYFSIYELLENNGYKLTPEMYINGYCKRIDGKQMEKIGKVIERYDSTYMEVNGKTVKRRSHLYKMDPLRGIAKKDLKVVICRHPYDIAGMSTDRNWTSCMNLGTEQIVYKKEQAPDFGSNWLYVFNDIYLGSLVAYLVDARDTHESGRLAIRRPLSRITIKPFVGANSDDIVYGMRELPYGIKIDTFVDFVREWVRDNLNNDPKDESYFLPYQLYNDGERLVQSKTKPITTSPRFNKLLHEWFVDNIKKHNMGVSDEFIKVEEMDFMKTTIVVKFCFDKKFHVLFPRDSELSYTAGDEDDEDEFYQGIINPMSGFCDKASEQINLQWKTEEDKFVIIFNVTFEPFDYNDYDIMEQADNIIEMMDFDNDKSSPNTDIDILTQYSRVDERMRDDDYDDCFEELRYDDIEKEIRKFLEEKIKENFDEPEIMEELKKAIDVYALANATEGYRNAIELFVRAIKEELDDSMEPRVKPPQMIISLCVSIINEMERLDEKFGEVVTKLSELRNRNSRLYQSVVERMKEDENIKNLVRNIIRYRTYMYGPNAVENLRFRQKLINLNIINDKIDFSSGNVGDNIRKIKDLVS